MSGGSVTTALILAGILLSGIMLEVFTLLGWI